MNYPVKKINELTQKIEKDLFDNIVPFWLTKTKDIENGGFFGRITNDLKIEPDAPKSLILHSRILWTFAFLYGYKPHTAYLKMCDWTYQFIMEKFFDKEFGGMYWMLDSQGRVIENNKKMYGQAFTIYALAEYYKVTKTEEILTEAIRLYHLIEANNYDRENKGYFEGSFRNWQIDKNISLSVVDMNEVKSMNTHLHLMEAYTNLYRVWPDEELKSRLRELISLHLDFIIDPQSKHLKLFFDEKWNSKSRNISFGHDIECSWLLSEAAQLLNEADIIERVEKIACDMVDVTIEQAFGEKYTIYAEKEANGNLHSQLEWWQQAEAMVGFVNAYEITANENYLTWAWRMWDVIEKYIIDHTHGEWFYGVDVYGNHDPKKHKVSEWKGPYHNARACLEVLKRLHKVNPQKDF